MIKQIFLGLGLSIGITFPLAIVSCSSGEQVVEENVLTAEVTNSFFATGGKWEGKTSLVAQDFKGFTSIGSDAFQGRIQLYSVDLPNEIIRIEDQAFFQAELRYVTLGNRVQHIGNQAFSHCHITEIILPPSLKTMDEGAFAQNELTSIIIPSSLKRIPDLAFKTNKIKSATIPNSITHIGNGAFEDNNLKAINIPNSVISIGSLAFAHNSFLAIPSLPNGIPIDDIFDNNQRPNPNIEIYTRKFTK